MKIYKVIRVWYAHCSKKEDAHNYADNFQYDEEVIDEDYIKEVFGNNSKH